MIVVKLMGGIGNQMFQYAIGRAISLKYKTPLKLDIGYYRSRINSLMRTYDLNVFNIEAEIAINKDIPFLHRNTENILFWFKYILTKIFRFKGKERYFHFNSKMFDLGDDLYLDGHWQSYKYFYDIENLIRKDFTLKNRPDEKIQNLFEEVSKKNSLCVHFRRGDYVGNSYHEVADQEYYNKAISKIRSMTSVEKIYVFSDDIDWCKKNISFDIPTMFVDDSYRGKKGEGHIFLMSACCNFVIPNSTFSWWSAWLSERQNKIVVVPKRWFNDSSVNTDDLIPEDWIRI